MGACLKIMRHFLIPLLIIVSGGSVLAFEPGPDTLNLKPGDYVIFEDSSFYAQSDTILILSADLNYLCSKDQAAIGYAIYDSINYWAKDKPWMQSLLKLLIVKNSKTKTASPKEMQGLERIREHEGKRIRNIKIAKTEVFGASINDTIYNNEKRINRILNSTHIKTRNMVIRNNLIIKQGDLLRAEAITDNERILRKLPYIDDARIIPVPVSESEVDIIVITKDVYAYSAGLNLNSLKKGEISLYDLNFMGLGHRIQTDALFNYNDDVENHWGYGLSYLVDNLFGSFIKTRIAYHNAFDSRIFSMSARKQFISPDTKYSFGTNQIVSYTEPEFDTSISPHALRYYYQDYWVGRSYRIQNTRKRIILSGRYAANKIYERPLIEEREYHKLQTYSMYLASISYSRENFYRMNLIYNYGRTEDIPHGALWNFTSGYESNEFFKSFYSGLDISYGDILPKKGYLYLKAGVGGFYNKEIFDRGVVELRLNYFSRLLKANRFRIRQFINIQYTNGIRRFGDEYISLTKDTGIRGCRCDSLSGTERLVLNIETVAFSPYYLYGFRFTFYAFADMGIIGEPKTGILDKQAYSGLGIGLRVRNEHLAFQTLQIRFGFYPILPPSSTSRLFCISGEPYFEPADFTSSKPYIISFR